MPEAEEAEEAEGGHSCPPFGISPPFGVTRGLESPHSFFRCYAPPNARRIGAVWVKIWMARGGMDKAILGP